jgi:hypothetical protein
MKKKILPLIVSIIIVVFCTFMIPVLVFKGTPQKTSMQCKETFTVTDGTVQGDTPHIEFDILEDGEYIIYYSWMPEGTDPDNMLSMDQSTVKALTVIHITDQDGNNVFGTNAGALKASTTNYLTKGRYTVEFTQFVNRDAYVEYAKEYLCANADAEMWADGYDFTTAAQNGECTMVYSIAYNPVQSSSMINLVYFLIIIVFTIAVIILVSFMANNGSNSPKFDERQIAEQGKAYKLGFFATIIAIGVLIAADVFGLVFKIEPYALYGSAVFVGLTVFIIHCVWHEAYFGVNQKTVPLMISLGFIGFANTIISINNFISGRIIENGFVTFRILNVFCAIIFLILFGTLLIKKISNAKNNDDDDLEETDV